MEESAIRVALYAREVAPTEPDPEPSLYLPDKWDELEKALESNAEVVAVAFPEVLGDTSPNSWSTWVRSQRAARGYRL